MEQIYYYCKHCGNIIVKLNDSGIPLICCGEKLEVLNPNTNDGAREKHIPIYSVRCGKVTVNIGEIPHPMIPEHYIEWVELQTNKGTQFKRLTPNTEPTVTFNINNDENVEAVFAYCNLHSLWKG